MKMFLPDSGFSWEERRIEEAFLLVLTWKFGDSYETER